MTILVLDHTRVNAHDLSNEKIRLVVFLIHFCQAQFLLGRKGQFLTNCCQQDLAADGRSPNAELRRPPLLRTVSTKYS